MYDSTTPPDPQTDPQGFYRQQQQARQLQQQGMQGPAPSTDATANGLGYARQLASALAGGYKMNQLRDAARASDLLNGGTGQVGGFGGFKDFSASPLGQAWGKVAGMFSGGG